MNESAVGNIIVKSHRHVSLPKDAMYLYLREASRINLLYYPSNSLI
jgi:hypothetical protein